MSGRRRAGHVFDEMPPKKAKPSHGDGAAEDRLSALPDAALHHVMSFLRAWEVARTCVLSRRWRHLWASAPCVDLRVWRGGGHLPPPEQFARFSYRLLFEREVSAPVDILRVMSSPYGEGEDDYTTSDVQTWIRAAIKRRARVIQLTDHPMDAAFFNMGFVPIISCHLKHLKLSGSLLWNTTLMQLSSQCPALEILELKKCSLHGSEISSTSLKSLTMVKCRIMGDLTIAAPNLVSLRCIKPYNRAPLFEDIGSLTLATGTIVLDDSVLFVGFDYEYKDFDEDAIDGSNSDDGEGCTSDSDYDDSDAVSEANTCEYSEIADDYDDEKQHQEHGEGHNQIEDDYDDENQDEEHSEEHNQMGHDEVLGGHNVLHILSNARNLELLADGGEVILNRELKTCPTFRNLKTLSLGEWCMGADFDPLVTFLQHSPNLERLFLELKLDYYSIQAMKGVTKPVGRSFACTHLKMVKIKCSMDDARVHWLAQLFRTNGLPIENIFVRQSHSTYLPTRPQ